MAIVGNLNPRVEHKHTGCSAASGVTRMEADSEPSAAGRSESRALYVEATLGVGMYTLDEEAASEKVERTILVSSTWSGRRKPRVEISKGV